MKGHKPSRPTEETLQSRGDCRTQESESCPLDDYDMLEERTEFRES